MQQFQQQGWQQQQQQPYTSHQTQQRGRAAGAQCADSMASEGWTRPEPSFVSAHGLQHLYGPTQQFAPPGPSQQQQGHQRWDVDLDDDLDLDMLCRRTDDDCASDVSGLSCSAEVAAALAAARQRMGQRSTPINSRHRAKAATPPPRAAGLSGDSHRGPKAGAAASGGGSVKGSNTSSLAALANATLRKLEQLSTESPTKQWR